MKKILILLLCFVLSNKIACAYTEAIINPGNTTYERYGNEIWFVTEQSVKNKICVDSSQCYMGKMTIYPIQIYTMDHYCFIPDTVLKLFCVGATGVVYEKKLFGEYAINSMLIANGQQTATRVNKVPLDKKGGILKVEKNVLVESVKHYGILIGVTVLLLILTIYLFKNQDLDLYGSLCIVFMCFLFFVSFVALIDAVSIVKHNYIIYTQMLFALVVLFFFNRKLPSSIAALFLVLLVLAVGNTTGNANSQQVLAPVVGILLLLWGIKNIVYLFRSSRIA